MTCICGQRLLETDPGIWGLNAILWCPSCGFRATHEWFHVNVPQPPLGQAALFKEE